MHQRVNLARAADRRSASIAHECEGVDRRLLLAGGAEAAWKVTAKRQPKIFEILDEKEIGKTV